MAIGDLAWASHLEMVRLPALDQAVAAQDAQLQSFAQSWSDQLAATAAQVGAAREEAASAQSTSFQTSTRVYENELYVQTYVNQKIQELKDQLALSGVELDGYLNGDLLAWLQGRIDAITPELQAIIDANTSSVSALRDQILAAQAAIDEANDLFMNTIVPRHDATLETLDDALLGLQSNFDLLTVDMGSETLAGSILQAKAEIEGQLRTLPNTVLKLPITSWTTEGHTGVFSPKLPPLPAWFIENDPSFLDCIELPLGEDVRIGAAYPTDFSASAIYEVEVRLKVSEDGLVNPGVGVKLGATTFAGSTVADLAVEKWVSGAPFVAANGDMVVKCRFSADLTTMTEQGYAIGALATDTARHLPSTATRTKIFFYVRQNPDAATGGRLRVRSIKVTDILTSDSVEAFAAAAASSANQAGLHADAAFQSESNAATHATTAGVSAAAADASKISAETAKAGSEAATASAVIAKEGAEDAMTAAQQAVVLTSRVVGQSTGVTADQFLGSSSGYLGWITSPVWSVNALYPQGQSARFTLAATGQGGLTLASDASAYWPGVENAVSYYVEFEFTVHSGATLGMGVHFDWMNTVPENYRVTKTLADMVAAPIVAGKVMTARAIFKKPDGFVGTFARNRIYVAVADSTINATLDARDISIHRIFIRPGTSEELGNGEIVATMSALFATTADMNSAIAGSITTYDAQVAGGVAAKVSEHVGAISTLEGNAAASYVLRVGAGGAAAGLELVAADDAVAGAASSIRMSADNILLDGSVTANHLTTDTLITTSAQIGEAVIVGANIANLTVGRLKIASNAVTRAGNLSFADTGKEIGWDGSVDPRESNYRFHYINSFYLSIDGTAGNEPDQILFTRTSAVDNTDVRRLVKNEQGVYQDTRDALVAVKAKMNFYCVPGGDYTTKNPNYPAPTLVTPTGHIQDEAVTFNGESWRVITWVGNGTLTVEGGALRGVRYLLAGGGGGGGRDGGGGGGGGGIIHNIGGVKPPFVMGRRLLTSVHAINVGLGGAGATTTARGAKGGDSFITLDNFVSWADWPNQTNGIDYNWAVMGYETPAELRAEGGGGGGSRGGTETIGGNGGCGGGGASSSAAVAGGLGSNITADDWFNSFMGSNGGASAGTGTSARGGGGGGAGWGVNGKGSNAVSAGTVGVAGSGTTIPDMGTYIASLETVFGTGGNGGSRTSAVVGASAGGVARGGNGGGQLSNGGAGSKGVVVLMYPYDQESRRPYTIHYIGQSTKNVNNFNTYWSGKDDVFNAEAASPNDGYNLRRFTSDSVLPWFSAGDDIEVEIRAGVWSSAPQNGNARMKLTSFALNYIRFYR